MKKLTLRRLLELVVNPYRFNDTALYQLYIRLRYPKTYALRQQEMAFYHALIRQAGGGLVFDVGANGGAKAIIFAKVAKQVVCVEPSPAAVHILRERFANQKAVAIVDQGVGAQPGFFPFHMFGDTDCYNTFSSKWSASLESANDQNQREVKQVQTVVNIPVTTLDALIAQFGVPDYLKIDVEGFESEVLKGLSQPVHCVSIECNLPEFEQETLECLTKLEQLRGGSLFNYCVTEPPIQFASDRWLSQTEMAQIVVAGGHSFMEIYCKGVEPL